MIHTEYGRTIPRAAAAAVMSLLIAAVAIARPAHDDAPWVAASTDRAAEIVALDPAHAPERLRITATPDRRTVRIGQAIRIVGTVRTTRHSGTTRPRTVRLVESRKGGWSKVSATRSTAVGAFTLTTRAGTTATTRVLRVEAPRSHGLAPVHTSVLRIRVVAQATPADPTDPTDPSDPTEPDLDAAEPLPAGYVAVGNAADWTYAQPGGGRWNPCSVIRWAYNPSGQAYDALPDVRRAFAKIAGVSGLEFTYVGATTGRYLGSFNDPAFATKIFDIAVGWANASEYSTLAGNVVGVGGAGARPAPAGAGVAYQLTRGFLTLDNESVRPAGFEGYPSWGPVMLHEILHSLGLGHAASADQLMYGTFSPTNTKFGAGDIAGMQKIGAPAGCLA
jgi:hypothetical protein